MVARRLGWSEHSHRVTAAGSAFLTANGYVNLTAAKSFSWRPLFATSSHNDTHECIGRINSTAHQPRSLLGAKAIIASLHLYCAEASKAALGTSPSSRNVLLASLASKNFLGNVVENCRCKAIKFSVSFRWVCI